MTALDRVLGADPPPFALLHRPSSAPDVIDLLVGEVTEVDRLADLPLPPPGGRAVHEVLAVLPYRQIAERGFACPDDGAPLLAMTVREQVALPLADVRRRLPDRPISIVDGGFDADDAQYAATVRTILADEIGRGTGANFVVKRSFFADIPNWSPATALAFFRRLLGRDPGAYWTFLIHTGGRTFVGASPERHISLSGDSAVMNPISGTYRYPTGGPELAGLLAFLSDTKEANELYMVLDEELKVMGRVCEKGGRAVGPHLKQMARVAHTEYHIEGRSVLDVREILRETMFAPTVTGGPVESACRAIARYEPEGRGYYAGVAALIGRDPAGDRTLDSAILIRTADIAPSGRMRLSVGATLVRDSCPESEAAETRAKAAGLLDALCGGAAALAAPRSVPDLTAHPSVSAALARRNLPLSSFWFAPPHDRARPASPAAGSRILVIDAEDTFTLMARHVIAALGVHADVRRFDEEYRLDGYDLVIVGPGPGDPRDGTDPKIAHLREVVDTLLHNGQPFFAVCLGHQVLSTRLGLALAANPVPSQGVQREVELFGRTELVGFYNTFAARCATDRFPCPVRGGWVEVSREAGTGQVHGLRGPGFASVQFHPVSVLTRNGVSILGDALSDLLTGGPVPPGHDRGSSPARSSSLARTASASGWPRSARMASASR